MTDCPVCGGTGFLRHDQPPGHPNFGKVYPCPDPIHTPDQMARLSQVSNLPAQFLTRTLADITENEDNREMLAAARLMIDEPYGWLYIWGASGNAKTEVLISLVNHLNQTGRGPAVYTKLSRVLDYMRDAYTERKRMALEPGAATGSYIERFRRMIDVPVLAIDEMDKARSTEFAEDFKFDFLDERYMSGLARATITIFAGNENPESFPEPLWDRFRDGRFRIVHNEQPSARAEMR